LSFAESHARDDVRILHNEFFEGECRRGL
jgi:hypothetical protein